MPVRKSIRRKPRWQRLLEGTTAIIATVNFALIIFDLTYINSRYFWLTGKLTIPLWNQEIQVPGIAHLTQPIVLVYDQVKGIKTNLDVQRYLHKLDELKKYRQTLNSPEAKALILDLQNLSNRMLQEDPFQLSGKASTLEKIQNRMRGYTGLDSSQKAFAQFWNVQYLVVPRKSLEDQSPLTWFEEHIRPLMERSNYIREIDKSGEFVNTFFAIDWFFRMFFLAELGLRVVLIKTRIRNMTLREAILKRWYDFSLIIPLIPSLLWLRIFPVIVRLREAGFNFEPIRAQLSRGFVAIFAGELTEVIALQTINQLQTSIARGEITTWLLQSSQRQYIDLNDINEIEVISRRFAKLLVYDVLPKIQTDLEAILNYNMEQVFEQHPFYTTLQQLPGLGVFPERVTKQFVASFSQLFTEFSQSTYDTLTADDPVALQLLDRLSQHFREAFTQALQDEATLEELQSLLTDLLEEVKVNYVRRLSEEDFEQLIEEVERLNRRN